ncbi:MAG: hypothetical protein HA493_01460 [Candidatus Verstraetearchaeota archaeon]|nr:hypothetical protein [Candidatus Verstraetearchaeota archaeon]
MVNLKDIKLAEEHSFAYNRVIGNVGKELVRTLLEACGYSVYSFGYESYFTHIKDLMHTGKIKKVSQLQRMPDLLAVDEERGDIEIIEVIVRTRKKANDVDIEKKKLEELRKFWPGSILVIVLPKDEHVFYAEKIDGLNITNPDFVNFDISHSPIEKTFTKIGTSSVLKELQDLCKRLLLKCLNIK